eukprot:CAMPEP_0180573856 /NCGR_PEP_ID=MMETSP1037_2-20121125/9997_1 /TAXON_ID=632150 /ORGANISM="Azadinium spinosum, Strain 3D9" /LENGTH=844 /DNA_ID=CAMNT_0022591311 /DNA_START=142 /DNA_END=2676 /DNA_ORIENTATION=-
MLNLKIFHLMVYNPIISAIALLSLITATLLIGFIHFDELRKRPTESQTQPYSTRLSEVELSLRNDFPLYHQASKAMESPNVVIWCKSCNLNSAPGYVRLLTAVEASLTDLRRHQDGCESMDIDRAQLVPDRSLAIIPLRMKQAGEAFTSAMKPEDPCMEAVRHRMRNMNGRYPGLSVASFFPSDLTAASLEGVSSMMHEHFAISIPIIAVILVMALGNITRAIVPFICFGCSYAGLHASHVVLKWCWENYNFMGPDDMGIFLALALSMDYALFFWTRFSQERKLEEEGKDYKVAIVNTLATSGAVILLSMAILMVAYFSMCFYPSMNTMGMLSVNIASMTGIFFSGTYSLAIPAVLASLFPSLFDEAVPEESCFGRFHYKRIGDLASVATRRLFERWSSVITSSPCVYVLPLIVYACFIPFLVELGRAQPNFDISQAFVVKSLPEYQAFEALISQMGSANPATVSVMFDVKDIGVSHRPPSDASAMMQLSLSRHTSDSNVTPIVLAAAAAAAMAPDNIVWSPEFGAMVCHFVKSLVDASKDKNFAIGDGQIQSPWWDSNHGRCVPYALLSSSLDDAKYASTDGSKMIMTFQAPFHVGDEFCPKAQALSKFLWSDIEPQAERNFEVNGQVYHFRAQHTSPLANQMLLNEKWASIAPWTFVFLIAMVWILVASVYRSLGVGFKMIMTVVVPIASVFGFAVGIFQHGWLEWLGIQRTGDGIWWSNFYVVFGVLFGLAVDYDLFLFARMYEHRMHGYDNISAVRMAMVETGPTITIAGTLMAVSFLFFAMSPAYMLEQMGFIYFIGILMDTYIIRTIIAPSALCISESFNYWPGKVPVATKSLMSHPL